MLPALLVACLTPAPPAGGPVCLDCHGSDGSAAPPAALGGETDPGYIGVGAHRIHLEPNIGVPVACDECHEVPGAVDAPGHIDDPWPAEVRWGELSGMGAAPFDHDAGTCTVYCHGATLADAGNPNPLWTGGPDETSCAACHGNPPSTFPHTPSSTNCSQAPCHVRDAATQHVDGVVQHDFGGTTPPTTGDTGTLIVGCAGCHGTGEDDLAPPPDTLGNTDPSVTAVGAHTAHLEPDFAAPVACEDCHVVPATVGDPGHLDAAPAEVTFAGLAIQAKGPAPTWTGATCADTYCHAGYVDGATPEPVWTTVDGSQDGCGACHGLPPPPPHPVVAQCTGCHPNAGKGISIAEPSTHIDGVVDL